MNKFLDSNGLLYVWSHVKSRLNGKVDKQEGKGLSTNDYTSAEKEKLAKLENYVLPAAGAETLGGVKVGAGLSVQDGVLSAAASWDSITGKPEVALKSDLASVYRYKGSVGSYAALPEGDSAVGDVWNVEDTGMNYAWTGQGWDALGEGFSVQAITNGEIDAIVST